MTYEILERPGQTGFKKKELEKVWDGKYGTGKWKKLHIYEGKFLEKEEVFKICEEAYYQDSLRREKVWLQLIDRVKDVYDLEKEEVLSKRDYSLQNPNYTRFHDICIRNVLFRRNWTFKGNKIVQIRWNEKDPNWFSKNFDPGKVKFHKPKAIISPSLKGWWDKDSVEDFYQSNKVLVKKL